MHLSLIWGVVNGYQGINHARSGRREDEGVSYSKGPGAVGVRGVVAGEERCPQCPLDA